VEAVFERVDRERGSLDALVNNAFLMPDDLDPDRQEGASNELSAPISERVAAS
jgi:NAD(P)-dependent dehydrogenase (short-subunit alcohol dehydrogenase family)